VTILNLLFPISPLPFFSFYRLKKGSLLAYLLESGESISFFFFFFFYFLIDLSFKGPLSNPRDRKSVGVGKSVQSREVSTVRSTLQKKKKKKIE
jgi:hypothetical protein